jgi:hypothetical protein
MRQKAIMCRFWRKKLLAMIVMITDQLYNV